MRGDRKFDLKSKEMLQRFNRLRLLPHLYGTAGRSWSRERSGFSVVQMIIGGEHSQAQHVDPCIWNTHCRGRHRSKKRGGLRRGGFFLKRSEG